MGKQNFCQGDLHEIPQVSNHNQSLVDLWPRQEVAIARF